MTILHTIFLVFSSADRKVLHECPNFEKIKHARIGAINFINFAINLLIGTYCSFILFKNIPFDVGVQLIIAVIFGFIWSFLVYEIDGLIFASIRKNGNSKSLQLFIPKLLIVILIASLGAFCIDLALPNLLSHYWFAKQDTRYWFFFILLFVFQTMPILIRILSPISSYDEKLYTNEEDIKAKEKAKQEANKSATQLPEYKKKLLYDEIEEIRHKEFHKMELSFKTIDKVNKFVKDIINQQEKENAFFIKEYDKMEKIKDEFLKNKRKQELDKLVEISYSTIESTINSFRQIFNIKPY